MSLVLDKDTSTSMGIFLIHIHHNLDCNRNLFQEIAKIEMYTLLLIGINQ